MGILVTYDIGIAQCDNRTVKYEKKKKKGTIECDKNTVTYDVGTIQSDNKNCQMWEKNKGTIECDKSTIIYDVGAA